MKVMILSARSLQNRPTWSQAGDANDNNNNNNYYYYYYDYYYCVVCDSTHLPMRLRRLREKMGPLPDVGRQH